uniref:Small ribosomal subunit protein mS33 n=1 Tax=Caligus rogercresseyi TaxID=217165 RepID=C1BMR6_CALRO|nr:Mitochondrial 28S ribosomal protein S33 [Caligus rogercresseyi]|eukprot:TRINITY_DN2075_c0_g1_i1.p1 TRINITY_DN2075_c0_g1~~TRINITY_DN2075_c0_g1_i1.p1  ORF type:complete len:115 (+),score=27.85 TRINITY_DN2075_c0_g1_i1:347-691(+)
MSKTTKFFTYSRALAAPTDYAKRMRHLKYSIFGEVRRDTSEKSREVVAMFSRNPYDQRREIVEYYPAHEETSKLMKLLRDYGLYRDEHEDFKEEMARLRALRGKVRFRRRYDKS